MFQYFVADHHYVIPEGLPARLRELMRDGDYSCREVLSPGPGNQTGCIVTLGDPEYAPERQQWHRSECGEYHVGWERDGLPSPEELIRPTPLDGDWVDQGDGRRWLVPILHGPWATLPEAEGYGPNGDVQLLTLPRYQELAASGEHYHNVVYNGAPFGDPGQWMDQWQQFVVALLGVNYRVNVEECRALLAILRTSPAIQSILVAALGLQAIDAERDAQKKTSTPPAGSAASPPVAA